MITAIPSLAVNENTEIEIPELTGDELVINARGIPPEVQAGKLVYRWPGFSHSVQLNNGSFYPLQERVGKYALDAGIGRHGQINHTNRGLVAGTLVDLWEIVNSSNSAYYLDGENELKITLEDLDFDFSIELSITTISATNKIKLQINEDENETSNISFRSTYKKVKVNREGNVYKIEINGVLQPGSVSADVDYSNKDITISGSSEVPVIVKSIKFNRGDSSFIEILSSDEVKPKNQVPGLQVTGRAKVISIPMRWDQSQQIDSLLSTGSRISLDDVEYAYENRIINQHDQTKYNAPIETGTSGKWMAIARSFLPGHLSEVNVVRVLNRL